METKRRIPFILVLLCLSWDQVYPQEYNDGDEFDLTNECGSNPLDLVLLVDTSDANNANYDREVRNFLSEFVEYADVNSGAVRVALVTYSTGVQIEFRLGEIDNIAGIQKAIRNVPFTPGDRNTADALEMLRRGIFFEPYGDRPDAPNALIIITSGNSNRNTGRTVPQAEALHQGGVSILVIGIGVQDEEETNGMASSPANENTFYLQSIDELSIIQDLVFVQLCAPGDALDLIFLFHFSNDMSEENFRYILTYVSGLLIGADIDNGNVRVGAALYRHDGVPLFQLNQYQRKEDIINAIENIPYNYRSASASLSAGIETVRTNMFQRQAGDRDEAPNGLILITDSTSNINVNKVANEAESLHNAGVTVFGIGIGLRSTDEVRTVVSANDNTYLMRNVNQLPALTGRLQDRIPALKAILPQPTEAPTPATEPEPEPTTAAPEVITVMEPTTIENSDIADVLVVFHSSHKTKAKDFNRNLKPFLSDIFAKAKIEPNKVRVAVVNYGNRVNSLFNFNTHTTKQKARGAIRKIKARLRHSKSNLGATLRHIRTQEFSQRSGSRISQGVPGAIILVTDMPSDSGTIDALDEAELLKRSGISILTVGIGDADRSELSAISSKPEYAQYVPNYATLKSNINILENIKDTVYALQGPNSRKPPPTAIVVRTAQPIPETTLAPERVTQISKSKLAILFHASSSTSARNYNKKLLVFMSNLLEDNRLDLTKLDVGVFNFGRAPMTVFEFGAHKNKEDLQNSILKIPKSFRSPSSNLGRTLKMLNETNNVFGGLPQNVLIISDTPSVFVQEEDNRYIDRLKSANSKIYFIGISYPYDGPMQSVVSEPHSKYFYTVENYESLLNDESLKRNFVSSLLKDLDSSENGQILPILNTEPIDSEQDTRLQQSSSVKDNEKTYLAILFQSSSSTSPKDYFKNLLIFLSNLVSENHFNSSTLDVALINYGKTTRVLFNFNSQESLSSAKSAILKAPKTLRSKKANIGDALQILNRDIFNTSERNYGGRGHVVVVADKIFDHSLKTVPEANVLKNAGIKIHSIGISDKTKNDLRTISSGPDTLYFQNVGNYAELNQNPDILQRVISGIRSSPSKPEQRTTTTTQTTTTVSNTIGHVTTNNDVRHVAILFQSSSSTSPSDYFRHLLVFLSNIADEQHFLSNKTNFALVNYGKKNRVLFNFNTYRDIRDVKNAITKAPKNLRSKKSNIGEALKIMNTDIFNTSERNYGGKGHLVLLSDKKFDVTKVNALEEAKLLRNSGIRIHTIGVTDKPLEDMEDLVSWPLDNYFQTVESYPELIQNPSVLQHLLANIKSSPMDPRITTLPTPSSTVTSKTPDPTEADVVLVFHALENVKKTDYKKKLLKFLFKLVKKADIDKGKVRVALVNYGNDAQTIFDLTQYKTKKTVIKAIKKTPKNLKFKNSDLGKALRLIRTSIFRPPKDRHGVQNHVILVTDSTSTGSSDQMHEEVRLLKESGVMFHTVGIGNVNKDELKFIASDPDSKHLQILKSHSELLKMKKSAKKIFKAIPALRKKKKGKGNKKPKKTKKPKTPTTTYLSETTRVTTLVPTVATDTTSVARHVKTRITTTLDDKTTRSIQPQSSPITSPSSSLSSTAAVTPTTTTTSSKITTVILSTPKVTTHSPIIKTTIKRTVKTTEKLLTPVPTSTIKITETSTGRNVITTTESKILTAKPTEKQHEKQTLLPTQNMITKTKSVTTAYQSSKSITVKEKTEQQTQFPTQSIIFNTTHKSITDPPTRGETVTKKTEKQTLPTQITFTRITRKFTTDPTKEETAWKKTEKETTIQTKSMITNATQIAVTQLSTNTMRSTPIEILETNNIDKTTIPNQEDISSITAMVPVLPLADSEEADIVVAVHSSRSTSEDDFSKLKTYLKSLFAKADVNSGKVQISCIVYGRDARTIFYLNQYNTSQQVSEAIDRISPRMRDNIVDSSAALVRAREMFGYGARATVPKALFMITDSASTVKTSTVENQKALLQGDGVDIFSIGVGIRDKSELELLSTSPNNIYNVQGYGQLAGNAEELRNRVYALNTAPAPPVVTVLPGTPGPIERITPSRETGTVGPPIKITFPSPTVGTQPPTPEPSAYDLVIILDSSVNRQTYQWMLDFSKRLTRQLNIDGGEYRVGVLRYSTNADVQFNLNDHLNQRQIRPAIDRIQHRPGQTNTAKAFETVRTQMFRPERGDRPYARNYILLLTGNEKSLDTNEIWREAERVEDDDIGIFVVGINTDDTSEIDETSTHPLLQYRYLVRSRGDLLKLPRQLDNTIRGMPDNPPSDWPRRRPRLTTTTMAPTTTTPKPTGYDLVIVLDSSVTPEIYQWMLNFAKRLTNQLNVDGGEYRVGVMSYSTYANVQFNLDDHLTQSRLSPAIERIQYRPGETNTAKALETVRTRMFRHSEGDRDYARNFILLLTGNEESLSTNDAWAAAERAEDDGIGIYVIGIDINNTNEIDEVASHPLSEYRFLVRRESDFMEIPGQMDFRLHKMPERPPRQWPRRRPRLTTPAPTRRPLPRPEKCTSVGDIVFILDSSGSVGRDNFYNVLNFTYNTVDELDIDTGHYRIGVITFSDNARTEFRLDRYNNKRDIERALTQVRYIYGSTHTAAALRLARTELFQPNGDRPDVPNVIVIVTDGESNINHLETIPEAMILKRSGVSIITVAIGFTDRSSELIGLTSPPITENLIRVESFDSLDRLKDKLVAPLCTDTDMCSPNPCQNGGRCIDGLRSYICQCTEGFHGENCNKRCGEPADVVFVLDSSNTVGRETFRRMKSYAEQLVTEMDVEVCDIRIGVMKYSSRSMVQFHVGAYRDTDTINRVIDSVSYTRGRANMAGAFNTLRRRMFHGNGDRTNVRNIAYILTDGSTDINAGNTMQEAELAIQSGIYIVPVGVSLRERGEVESIALSQGTNTIEIDSEDTFMTMRDEVLRPIFDLTDHCATNPCKHGGTCRNGGNGYTCSCVPGFTGDRCQKRCDAQGDIVFAVDTSRYSTRKELRRVKRFLRSLVKRMSFKRQGFRVGIVEYNSNAKVSLTFQNGRKKKAALAAVSGIRSRGGDPDPTEALRKAHLRIFDNEDRRNVPNYLIFVTKSMNNENNVIREANKLKVAGARIIGVGIGLTTSEKEFLSSAVSSPIPSYMYNVPNVQGLNDVADSIMTMLCDERNMCESDPCGNRGECIPTPGSYYCQCRPGYAGKTCQKACNAKADVAFLLDSSGSVGQKNFQKIKNFLIHMVDDMTIGFDATRVGVASFSDTARLAFYMDQYMTKEEVRRAISGVDYEYGNTNTASGIKLARNHILDPKRGDRKDVQNFLIIITDGLSNINAENTLKEAELAKEEGTHVISIGIGSFDPFEINAMATEPASKNAFIIDDFDRLFNISDKLVSATCRDPSVCDENPCRNGGVCTPLINGYKCKCKNGYRGTNCESTCQSKKDIVFVLDSSSSVGEVNFQQMLNFVKALIEELSAPGTNNRFGLVTYSTEPNLIFSLGRYTDPGTVSTAVATTRYTPGSTNTAGGLRTAMEIFTNNYGNRRDADDVVILVTDGESNVQAYNTIPSADELKRNNIKIISIGIGIRDSDEITRIASSTDDVFQVGGFESLSGVKTDILDTSCKRNEE